MIAFLNERSLGQYGDWSSSLTFFLTAALTLSGRAILLKDSDFFAQAAFLQRFNHLGFPKDQQALIRELAFGNKYYQCWRPERMSGVNDMYNCANPPLLQLHDESLCEAAERKLGDAAVSVSLLSASDSLFTSNPITLSKVAPPNPIPLRNAISIEAIRAWIAAERGYYDRASTSAPRDFQTILVKAPGRFQSTGIVERNLSRQVFKEIVSGRLYYVDDGHPGHSAHLEVFSPNGQHLGTADIDTGELDPGTNVEGRVFKF